MCDISVSKDLSITDYNKFEKVVFLRDTMSILRTYNDVYITKSETGSDFFYFFMFILQMQQIENVQVNKIHCQTSVLNKIITNILYYMYIDKIDLTESISIIPSTFLSQTSNAAVYSSKISKYPCFDECTCISNVLLQP